MNLSNENKLNNIKERLENAPKEEKTDAIIEAISDIFENKYAEEISKIEEQALKAESDADYKNRLGLRTLNQEEKDFYEKLKDAKQSITSGTLASIPTSLINLVEVNLERVGKVLSHVNMAPAAVAEWFTAQTEGSYAWKELTEAFDKQKDLKSTFKKVAADIGKLYVLIIIPKSIAKLGYEFIDKYFLDILEKQIDSGLNHGFFVGDGVEMPVGIYNQINKVNESGEHVAKDVSDEIVNFSPKGLAKPKLVLSKEGDRELNSIILFCNTADRANYVDPAMLDALGNNISSDKNIVVVDSPENPKGKAAFYLDKSYTMVMDNVEFKNYDQTLALEDADLLIGSVHANGRAVDDNCAFVFDVTKLEEYIPKVKVVGTSNEEGSGSEIEEA